MNPLLRTFIPIDPHEYDSLEEALGDYKHLQALHSENVYFVDDGKKPEWEDLRVCKAILVHSNYTIVRYEPLVSLEGWLLQHKNEVLQLYFGGQEGK